MCEYAGSSFSDSSFAMNDWLVWAALESCAWVMPKRLLRACIDEIWGSNKLTASVTLWVD
jgi:hypothetical protein